MSTKNNNAIGLLLIIIIMIALFSFGMFAYSKTNEQKANEYNNENKQLDDPILEVFRSEARNLSAEARYYWLNNNIDFKDNGCTEISISDLKPTISHIFDYDNSYVIAVDTNPNLNDFDFEYYIRLVDETGYGIDFTNDLDVSETQLTFTSILKNETSEMRCDMVN